MGVEVKHLEHVPDCEEFHQDSLEDLVLVRTVKRSIKKYI